KRPGLAGSKAGDTDRWSSDWWCSSGGALQPVLEGSPFRCGRMDAFSSREPWAVRAAYCITGDLGAVAGDHPSRCAGSSRIYMKRYRLRTKSGEVPFLFSYIPFLVREVQCKI